MKFTSIFEFFQKRMKEVYKEDPSHKYICVKNEATGGVIVYIPHSKDSTRVIDLLEKISFWGD